MILLIDNYDSFSFNLVQAIGELVDGKEELKAVRNDELTVDEVLKLNPSHIVLSPGPGKPSDAGICEELIKAVQGKIPLLGVCLGHQAICEALGGKITYAPELMHGKQSKVKVNNESDIFKGLDSEIMVARYHSLVADKDFIPDVLEVTAVDEKGVVMAVQHKTSPIYGLQFHPESIMTPTGKIMVRNFLDYAHI
jgi:anthranilate synthase component 2